MDAENNSKTPRFEELQTHYTSPQRSRTMSRIRGKDTRAEVMLRRALWQRGYRYRKNVKGLPGTPDIAIRKYKVAVFVDGEFWHGYNWEEKKYRIKRNRAYWVPKIERNMARDRENTLRLQREGWMVIRFWEKRLKDDFSRCLQIVVEAIEQAREGA
ncbi:very short patch repair endonuclease [Phaeodactylibacter luteus]|uniref:Very short patch repair endonuclease n=1 Tax=Phaeodactylibacter luteus TaxID=1564516 RepID=A0A5C6RN14_9BACT|nr:very short patch repair endonuclease [Phaeodactylibacter luteus]TXB63364.1 very short patch repair endonuclease [Phaeodactylibacter luteus]